MSHYNSTTVLYPYFNSVTARVKMLIYMYLPGYIVYLVQTLSNLMCSKYIYRSKWVDRFDWWKHCLVLLRVVKMTVKTSKKCPYMYVHIWVDSQNCQLTDFDHYSYVPLKFSCSRRRVNCFKPSYDSYKLVQRDDWLYKTFIRFVWRCAEMLPDSFVCSLTIHTYMCI